MHCFHFIGNWNYPLSAFRWQQNDSNGYALYAFFATIKVKTSSGKIVGTPKHLKYNISWSYNPQVVYFAKHWGENQQDIFFKEHPLESKFESLDHRAFSIDAPLL